jgi:hypothetical protein
MSKDEPRCPEPSIQKRRAIMRDRIHHWKWPAFIAGLCLACLPAYSQYGAGEGGGRKVIRVGGVVAGFIADPIGGPTDAMADAQAAVPYGLMTLNGNPAHAALIGGFEICTAGQLVNDLDRTLMLRTGYGSPHLGGLALDFTVFGNPFGYYNASLTYGCMVGKCIAAGASLKGIWNNGLLSETRGAAWDAGILVLPNVLTRTGKREDGLKIGASLANQKLGRLHNELKYREYGYYNSVDLPSVLRIGLSVVPVASEANRLTLAFDAVHPINDYESYNFGAEDRIRVRSSTGIVVRTGLRTRSYGNEMTAGLGLFWSSRGKSIRCEAGYSWMEETFAPDRHGFYLRLYR